MILAIDLGNSCLKCAVVDADGVKRQERLKTAQCGDARMLEDTIGRVLGGGTPVDKAIVSSVVPPFSGQIKNAVEKKTGMTPRFVDSGTPLPFRLDVPEPGQVGADRLCACAGVPGLERGNGIVIDAGSAITVDLVKDGCFLGGVIAAGPVIALRALHTYANKLPSIDFDPAKTPFPKVFDTTEASMTLGAGLGGIGAIEASVRHLEASAGVECRKYLTGGFGKFFSPHLPGSWSFDPDLTLKGLYVISSLS